MADGARAATTRSPEDWPTPPERRYAERQARLADQLGLDVDALLVQTDAVGPLHVLEAGDPDGEPVLLLHGITAPAASWLPLAAALVDDYRLLAPDLPGEGLSAKPSYRGRDLRSFGVAAHREILGALGLERPHVVGHSLGGWQAFVLAIDHDAVDRLCLVGAPVGLSRDFPLLPRLLTVRGLNRLLFRLADVGDPLRGARAWHRRFSVVDDAAIPEAYYELYAARRALPGLDASLCSLLDTVGSFGRIHPLADLRDEVVRIDRPTAFVWGTADYFWGPGLGRAVAARMADAAVHALDDHGHAPWLEPGDAAARLVRSFLDG